MKNDRLKEFVSLRESLLNEREQILKRLEDIDRALGDGRHTGLHPIHPQAGRGTLQNPLSLKEAVIKVTSAKPLSKNDILAGIHKLGYRFTTTNPINSLNVVLYGKRPKFKNIDGKFTPA